MRREGYDKLVKEALERIEALPTDKITNEVVAIKDALNVVLAETDADKLERYYKNIDDFYTVNNGRGLEYLSGDYLLNHGM